LSGGAAVDYDLKRNKLGKIMPRTTSLATAAIVAATAAIVCLPLTTAAFAADDAGAAAKAAPAAHGKRHAARHTRGYGFLPGYRPPEQLQLDQDRGHSGAPYYYYGGGRYYFGGPHFFRGRWNGGSFGPCWTSTPIGLMWTCG
jgi:hypothetical protein